MGCCVHIHNVEKIGDKHINDKYGRSRNAEAAWKTVKNHMVSKNHFPVGNFFK